MSSRSQSMSKLRILVTNDDGVNANGIKVLERIANFITPDVWVVAPEVGQSGKSYSITFTDMLRIKELSPRKFSISGTPTDCVFIALGEILKDKKPDLVLSGINHGANIADFIGLSGTVGAAFAAASQKIKAIAVSQYCKNTSELVKFPLAEHFLQSIIKKLLSFQWPDQICMNINFPDVPLGDVAGIKVAKQGKVDVTWNVHKRLDPVGDPYYWLHATHKNARGDDSDVVLMLEKKNITITPLQCRYEVDAVTGELEDLFLSNA